MKTKGIAYEFLKRNNVDEKVNLVFVHGTGCDKRFLKALALEFSEYNCYLIDLPGHGESDNTGFTIDNYVNSVCEFCSKLDNVILIGHSLGGTVVTESSSRNVESIKGVVILNSGASYKNSDKNFVEKINAGIIDMNYILSAFGDLDNTDVQKAIKTFGPNENIITDFKLGLNVNIEGCLDKINIPALIVTGGDEVLTLVEYSELLHKNIKDSELFIITKTKHMLPLSRKKQVYSLVKSYIKKYNLDLSI